MTTQAIPVITRPRAGGPSEMEAFQARVIDLYERKQCTATLLSRVRQVFRVLIVNAGITRIEDLTDQGILKYEQAMKAAMPDVKARTRAEQLRMLRAICHHGVKLRILPAVPRFPRIPQPREFPNVRQARRLAEKDVRRLLAWLRTNSDTWEGLRLYCLIAVIVYTGLRRDEALRLRLEDVDIEGDGIRVRRREDSPRSMFPDHVLFPAEVRDVLKSWMRRTDCPWLFPGKRKTGPWVTGNHHGLDPRSQLQAAGDAVGISGLTFEMLRRFFNDHSRPNIRVLEGAVRAPDSRPAIQLKGEGLPVLVLDRPIDPIGDVAYDAIERLLKAGPAGLGKAELDDACKFGSWRRAIRELRETDAIWRGAILMPGKPYGRYRIAWI